VTEPIRVGDRVRIHLDSKSWKAKGWFEGQVVRIEPYSTHRSFYWVKLAEDAMTFIGGDIGLISVLNPKKIQKME
jgi:multidrug resistance efflux pump